MAKRRYRSATKQASHAPEATKANKGAVVKLLTKGMSPAEAAEAVKVGRSTIYDWKKDDPMFSVAWDNAVQTSYDKLEGRLYRIAMTADDPVARLAIMDILKNRKGADWNNTNNGDRVSGSQTNYFLNMPMQEHIERLERLGLPVPVIESDREEDYATDTTKETDSP
jgi:Homeodomain-like domain